MPQTWQEWLALAIVAFTIGILLGRWLSKRRATASAPSQQSACNNCPSKSTAPKRFKNIPIQLDKSDR